MIFICSSKSLMEVIGMKKILKNTGVIILVLAIFKYSGPVISFIADALKIGVPILILIAALFAFIIAKIFSNFHKRDKQEG